MQASREINFPATFLALLLSPNHLSSMQTDPLASSVAHTLDVIPAYIRCRLETQLSGNWLYSGLPFTEEKSMERTAVIFARLSNCCYFWCWALSERIPKGQAKMAQPAMQVKPRLFPQWKDKAVPPPVSCMQNRAPCTGVLGACVTFPPWVQNFFWPHLIEKSSSDIFWQRYFLKINLNWHKVDRFPRKIVPVSPTLKDLIIEKANTRHEINII